MTTARAGRWTPSVDPGLAVALVFAAVAAWPLLSRHSLPSGTDAIQHLYRAYEILAAWNEGVLYTRWAPDFYYTIGRDQWGPQAAIVSAAAYAFAPYIALTDPVLRGAVPEAFAIGLGPVVLWAYSRLARTGLRAFFVLSVVRLAALVQSHNLISFAFAGLTEQFVAAP